MDIFAGTQEKGQALLKPMTSGLEIHYSRKYVSPVGHNYLTLNVKCKRIKHLQMKVDDRSC